MRGGGVHGLGLGLLLYPCRSCVWVDREGVCAWLAQDRFGIGSIA